MLMVSRCICHMFSHICRDSLSVHYHLTVSLALCRSLALCLSLGLFLLHFSSNSTLLTENRECIEKTLKTLCRIAKKAKHTAEKYAISFFKSFQEKSFNLWPYVCYSRSFSALLLEHNFGIHKLFFFSTSAYH